MRIKRIPVPDNLANSPNSTDLVGSVLQDYSELCDAGHSPENLPHAVRKYQRASIFVGRVINGGNGFRKYHQEVGFDQLIAKDIYAFFAETSAYQCLEAIRPHLENILLALDTNDDPSAAIEDEWQKVPGNKLKVLKDWYYCLSADTIRDYLRKHSSFEVLPSDSYKDKMQQLLRAYPQRAEDNLIETLRKTNIQSINIAIDYLKSNNYKILEYLPPEYKLPTSDDDRMLDCQRFLTNSGEIVFEFSMRETGWRYKILKQSATGESPCDIIFDSGWHSD